MQSTDLSSIIGQEVQHLTISARRVVVETAAGTLTIQHQSQTEALLVTVDE
jgi:hypothetical protein